MRAKPFVSFPCWIGFFYDCKCYVCNWKKETSTKPTLLVGWLWFTLLAVQTCKLNSKLPAQTHQLHHLASRMAFSSTITVCHIEKQQFYWNWATLPLQSSSLQMPKFNVDKPTQWRFQTSNAFLVRNASVWDIYLCWLISRSYLQSLSPLLLYIFIKRCYACSNLNYLIAGMGN